MAERNPAWFGDFDYKEGKMVGAIFMKSLKYYRGNRFIYVGEGSGGCTGDGKFHDLLEDRWYGNGGGLNGY